MLLLWEYQSSANAIKNVPEQILFFSELPIIQWNGSRISDCPFLLFSPSLEKHPGIIIHRGEETKGHWMLIAIYKHTCAPSILFFFNQLRRWDIPHFDSAPPIPRATLNIPASARYYLRETDARLKSLAIHHTAAHPFFDYLVIFVFKGRRVSFHLHRLHDSVNNVYICFGIPVGISIQQPGLTRAQHPNESSCCRGLIVYLIYCGLLLIL